MVTRTMVRVTFEAAPYSALAFKYSITILTTALPVKTWRPSVLQRFFSSFRLQVGGYPYNQSPFIVEIQFFNLWFAYSQKFT